MAKEEYWFNTKTNEVEIGKQSLSLDRLGPFSTFEEAKNALKNSEAIIVSGETEVIAEEIAFEEIKLPILLANLLKDINFTKSTSDARRLITSGAIKIDGLKITDEKHTVNEFGQLLQVSRKRFFRLIAK
jgi:tyrosyl-tRNA synthetase